MSHLFILAFVVLLVLLRRQASRQARQAVPLAPPRRPVPAVEAAASAMPGLADPDARAQDEDDAPAVLPSAPRRSATLDRFYRTVRGPGLCSPR
ncbi:MULTISPECIES: hypothetical protein [unclassified Novosphingobium]|uniref:hypothetical protein n=1 Tax=unclassified Novosphingobium TaxID=2644732 RepID=UPI000D327B2D|nr:MULTISPECIES: hypothetical protein [unclassified Novosphingobium]PTR05663.1 hypothetical protein C8K11_12811 [Novosphingobium sp. GV055]PUA94234.1 hypothetical protein C8K12_12811 [Novosphingobium sp. GV061]PUB12191.1 hypothetical protein C8K14_12811 [Novosphingobium sp. GV079]PUB37215.1 hypothetical protein C8K10_12811 [Novosphingobium sp. GV027]